MKASNRSADALASKTDREHSEMTPRNRKSIPAALLLCLAGMLLLALPASALGTPVLNVTSNHYGLSIPSEGYGKYELTVSNAGPDPTSAPITLNFTAPAGLKVTKVDTKKLGFEPAASAWNCTTAPNSQSSTCTGPQDAFFPLTIGSGQEACVGTVYATTCRVYVIVKAEANLSAGTLTPTVQACGGGAASCANASDPTQVGGPPTPFEITGFDGGVFDSLGDPETQAGSRPFRARTDFFFTQKLRAEGEEWSTEDLKDAIVDLPPGFVGNPQALVQCTPAQLLGRRGPLENPACPPASQVGTLVLWYNGGGTLGGSLGHPSPQGFPIFNMVPPKGNAAAFAINISGALATIGAYVPVPPAGEEYRVRTSSLNIPITLPFAGVGVEIWGVPDATSHDAERFCPVVGGFGCTSENAAHPKAFLSLPTSCVGPGPNNSVRTDLSATSWLGSGDSASFLSHDNTAPTPNPIGNDGCNALAFSPTLEARPTTNVADSPSGLDVNLHIPQNEDPNGTAEAHLDDTVVTLPEGLVVNPSSANGLDGCSPAEVGLHAQPPATCPDASKLGTVSIETPVLDHPVPGSVYIADPYDNPFNSLLALYITVNDEQSGVTVKLAGKVEPDPVTGQLKATFLDNPQLPFEDFRLHFFGGAGGSLRTPATCGTYSTTSSLTPWSAPDSGPPSTPSDSWAIEQGPGGSCANSPAELPNAPSFDAGTISPIAGATSPLVVNLRRQDGSQQFSSLRLTPPQGLVGKLAGIPACSEDALAAAAAKSGRSEEASPSCPQASYVGSVIASAGAGPAPYNAPGRAYLSGPYKGAPLSLAIITPATAGPFDLGTIVVKTALYVDSKTAQITAVADPIPSILQGIPLDVRSVQVKMDRPDFTLNPTSCEPSVFGGTLMSTLGQTTPLQSRFQVGECGRLGFKPQMTLSLKGGTKRGKYPALTAVLTSRPGDANLASISAALPHSEFLAQEHIRTVCTRVQFAADQCPEAAIYGTATVATPLLDYPLTGPVYLRSSDNQLPDLVPDLRGPAYQPIKIEAAGRTDSLKGGIRNTFDFLPDAPFTKLTLQMQGGKKGLLVNSKNICQSANRATVKYGAHNGLALESRPVLRVIGCPKQAKKKASERPQKRHAG
ncbi:MAG TPA: hypothetical protein VGO66_12140 [Solirubrobacterales bacterium]|jgi:hypothetical protein|nr:hypothetical protein [Solirubrobacterales bacterium]